MILQWQDSSVATRVRLLRWVLPAGIVAVVFAYQLLFSTYIHDRVGHNAHTAVEIGFYSIVGPIVAWLTLNQIGRWLVEKEEVERTVRSHERHLASIVDASADAILSLDISGVIRTWNRGASSLFHYAADEMIGQLLSKLFQQDREAAHTQRNGDGVRPPDEMGRYEGVCGTKTGHQVAVEVTQTPLKNDTGEIIGTSVILRDITPRKARERALEEERARIARDLHDGLAQSLYFLGLKLDFIRKRVHDAPETAVEELKALKHTVQANIQDVRRTIFALRPIDLAGMGFEPALRKYASEFSEQTGLAVTLETERIDDIPPALEPVFFRLIQEALNNVSKHAKAQHAQITLAVGADRIGRLSVYDDGIGFDYQSLPAANSGQMGLQQMQERVTQLYGRFELESNPRVGTVLRIEIPL